MRRISRIDRSIDLLRPRSSNSAHNISSLCTSTSCSRQSTPFSTSSSSRATSSFSDRLQKKLWKTTPGEVLKPPSNVSLLDPVEVDPAALDAEADAIVERLKRIPRSPTPDVKRSPRSKYVKKEKWHRYKPSTDIYGTESDGTISEPLEHVGDSATIAWYKAKWNQEHPFNGFLPRRKVKDPAEIRAALRRALVEIFALQQVGSTSLSSISTVGSSEDYTRGVQLKASNDGVVDLEFPQDYTLEQLIQSLSSTPDETAEKTEPTESEEDVAADRSTVDPLKSTIDVDETAEKHAPTQSEEEVAADRSSQDPLKQATVVKWDPSWMNTSIADPKIKFAVLKRMLQLTGISFPDYAISTTDTARRVLSHIIQLPKERKLFQTLSVAEEMVSLPNVSVHQHKISFKKKEESIGRWKVIEEELQHRGLSARQNEHDAAAP